MEKAREAGNIPRFPVYVLFFLSGACGLIYEIVWTRLLTLVMGSTIYSISTVLTAFMGGLALGSFFAGRVITGRKDELKIYGFLEGVIGVYCLLIPFFIDLFVPLYKNLYLSLSDSHFTFSLVRFLISFLILLVPATLMGATLPIMTKYFTRHKEKIGGAIGKVYAINTFGAVAGSFGAGFFLLPFFGTGFVIVLTASTNLIICFVALMYARRTDVRTPDDETTSNEIVDTGEKRSIVLTFLLFGFALSGFSAMIYQVIWTRMLTLLIGSSTYAFSLIVTAFILGIGFGSIALSRFIDRKKDLLLYFALAQLLIGTSAIFIAFAFGKLPFTMVEIISRFRTSFAMTQFAEFVLILALLLIPTTMMGALFPLVSRIYTRSLATVGRAVGNVYAANTVGAILGAFTGGFVFIPFLGMEKGLLCAVSLNFLIGFVFLLLSPYRGFVLRFTIAILWIGLSFTFEWWAPPWNRDRITMGPYIYFTEYQRRSEQSSQYAGEEIAKPSRLIYFKEGVSTTISVKKYVNGEISLQVNGKTDASSGADMSTQQLIAHIPMMLHSDPDQVLIIGLASGVTVGSIEKYPVEHITCVEISPAMVDASDFFRRFNEDALDDPRLALLIEDGRNHVLLTENRYDVIISQPTNPWISGVGSLFTLEYFELLEARLRENGIACVWLQAYGLEPEDFKMITRTFNEVFPYTSLWESLVGKDFIMIGQKKPFLIDFEILKNRFDIPAVAADLDRIGVESPLEFLKYFVSGPLNLRTYAGGGTLHTDDNSRLEFSCPRTMYSNTILRQLEHIEPFRESPVEFLSGDISPDQSSTLEAILLARRMSVAAFRSMNKGDAYSAENFLRMALTYFPGEEGARDMLTRQNAMLILKLVEMEKWEELEEISRATLNLDDTNFPATDGLSMALLGTERWKEAAVVLERGGSLYPDYAPFHANLGFTYSKMGLNDEAITSYEVAVAKDPANARYYFELGTLYFNTELFAKALQYFQKAIQNNSLFTEAFVNLGGTYARLGLLAEAKESFIKALEIEPGNKVALENLRLVTGE